MTTPTFDDMLHGREVGDNAAIKQQVQRLHARWGQIRAPYAAAAERDQRDDVEPDWDRGVSKADFGPNGML